METGTDFFNASGQVSTGTSHRYFGFAIRETSGSATASVNIRSNGASGEIIDVINLAANETAREVYAAPVIASNIYVEVVSGAVEGCIRWAS